MAEGPGQNSRGGDPGGPLDGYRVLELGGERSAFCGRLLADLGAEVIKVEPPGGDPVRRIGPFKDGLSGLECSLRFASLNVNKRGITLDVATAAGRSLLLRLLERAAVLLEDFDPGVLDGWGIDEDALRRANPALVHTSITGFGLSGPHAPFKGPDLVCLAMGGILGISGEPDRPPCAAPETQGYYLAGMHAAFGTVAALFESGLTGCGRLVEVSAQECLAAEEHQITRYSLDGHIVRREGSQHGSAAPGRIFPAKDGYVHFYVAGGAWPQFYEWMGSPDALSAEAWQDARFRRQNVDVLNLYAAAFAAGSPRDQLAAEGQARHIAIAPVNSPADVAEDPHMAALGFFQEVDHPALGRSRYAASPLTFSEAPAGLRRGPPLLGQDNSAVFGELGIEGGALAALHAQGVV